MYFKFYKTLSINSLKANFFKIKKPDVLLGICARKHPVLRNLILLNRVVKKRKKEGMPYLRLLL
ncbi:hypothetical protein JCM31826_14720 [Thermaurantimonas aggregans]|uniref:Uncharacterized protein n=1 Tax=Thermaurantimonas aggregans TaxID=2173829 RepID=A0A401XLV8_9FLAO|nr:hypothetical protein JCM31826_14720 [Thermaurantimonas aggregans]